MAAIAVALAAAVVSATPPNTIGECRVIRGRLDLWNGTPTVRIWVVGTRRILGVHPDEADAAVPSAVRRLWDAAEDRWEVSIFGDFEVCAETPSRPGRMQIVRVVDGQRLTVRPRR